MKRPRFNPSRQNAPVVEAIDVLDGKTQGLPGGRLCRLELVQRFEHGWSLPPRHGGAACSDVVAMFGGDGDETSGRNSHRLEKSAEGGFDLTEPLLGIVRQIHLVD